MISSFFLAFATLVAADIKGDISSAVDAGSSMSSAVAGWSSGDGIAGALAIQSLFDPVYSAVAALSSDASGATTDDIESFATLESASTALLKALEEKADDFSSVGSSQIVQNDISSIASAASGAMTGVLGAVSSEDLSDDQASSVSSIASVFSSGFEAAGSAFSVDVGSFPTFQYSGGGGSSSAETSSAESSAAGTSAEATSSAPASSSAASSPASQETSAPAVANGVSGLTVSLGMVLAGAAYLL